jgi:hypothetical protein
MLTLLSVEECTGLDCPVLSLPWFFVIYLIVMILTCCCCYPGACACPQRQLDRDSQTGIIKENEKPWHHKLNLLGSIGQVLSSEWEWDDIKDPLDDDAEEEEEFNNGESQLKRRRRIQY